MSLSSDLLTQTLGLPPADRAALVHQLLLSLEPPDFNGDQYENWATEFEARLDAVEQGQFSARNWREALADMRKTLQEERKR